MKVINIMNFVRQYEPRRTNKDHLMFEVTKEQLKFVNEEKLDNTFLLQYDVLCDENYVKLFKENVKENTELGLWLEIVEPLTTACNMPYRSEKGWRWDWHIIPGFLMGYKPEEREKLADEAMRKFKEVFGYYPSTIGCWLMDTHTINYLAENYKIDAFCNCRDQVNTDAYTLIGGYFNQGYYPSKNNMFTPAQTDEFRVNVPMFRLLGPSPIYDYDGRKFMPEERQNLKLCCTLEPVWDSGSTPEVVDWFFKSYYRNEDLGFSYSQLGQENSFATDFDFMPAFKMQIEKAKALGDVEFQKMGDTGRYFKETYKNKTPATSLVALEDCYGGDLQSVYYDCENYTVNIFRKDNQVFIRAWYLFDERVKDIYMTEPCTRFDAIYENLPIVDTVLSDSKRTNDIGILIDTEASAFSAEKSGDNSLLVKWNDKSVKLSEHEIEITNAKNLVWFKDSIREGYSIEGNAIIFTYKGNNYTVYFKNCTVSEAEDRIVFDCTGHNIVFSV